MPVIREEERRRRGVDQLEWGEKTRFPDPKPERGMGEKTEKPEKVK